MMLKDLFKEYETLAAKVEHAFQSVQLEHESCVRCEVQCSDCCHSVFGLFLIESAYLNYHLNKLLDGKQRQEVLVRVEQAEKELLEIEQRLAEYKDNPQKQADAMARERVRCPLLNEEQKCVLYPFRPITCRAYGMPTVMGGNVHACWKAGFEKGKSYPTFNLDGAYRELYRLSEKLLDIAGQQNKDRASLLLSVPKSVRTPLEDLLSEG